MERRGWIAVLAAAGLLAGPSLAAEDASVEAQLRQMQERMSRVEDRLEATTDELQAAEQRVAEQERVIREEGLAEGSGAVSGAAEFLESIEIGGWAAASYNYNFNAPDGRELPGSNQGATGFQYPFHPDSNAFQLDQLWLEIERPVDEEHRAGFRADIAYGKTAELLSGSVLAPDGLAGTENDFELYQGYVQYMAPIGSGVHLKFGKFATLIGAEVAQAPYNFNITRGHVYNLFQPITHSGLLASTELGGGFSASVGAVNGTRSNNDIELNNDKAVLWSLGFSQDVFSASFNGTFGSSEESQGASLPAGDKELILDAIVGLDPTENVSTYVNASYLDSENSNSGVDTTGWGLAWAGRVGITERLGGALRAEYATLESDGGAFMGSSDPELDVWGLTGTVDYALTDALTLKTELRWDKVEDGDFLGVSGEGAFIEDDEMFGGVGAMAPSEDDQLVGLVEVIYSF